MYMLFSFEQKLYRTVFCFSRDLAVPRKLATKLTAVGVVLLIYVSAAFVSRRGSISNAVFIFK